MATMRTGNLLLAMPSCSDCGLMSDAKSTFYGSGEFLLYCEPCRDQMDGVVIELAEKMMGDPAMQNLYPNQPEAKREELMLELAEDMYLSGEDFDD